MGFGDVVEALDMDYESEDELEYDLGDEESAPIIQLAVELSKMLIFRR